MGFSSCSSWALERRLSSCGARVSLHRGMWDLSGPGMDPCLLLYQVDFFFFFLATELPGKPLLHSFSLIPTLPCMDPPRVVYPSGDGCC